MVLRTSEALSSCLWFPSGCVKGKGGLLGRGEKAEEKMELSGDALKRPGPAGPSGQSSNRMTQMMEEWKVATGPDVGGTRWGAHTDLRLWPEETGSRLIHFFPSWFTHQGGEQGLERISEWILLTSLSHILRNSKQNQSAGPRVPQLLSLLALEPARHN